MQKRKSSGFSHSDPHELVDKKMTKSQSSLGMRTNMVRHTFSPKRSDHLKETTSRKICETHRGLERFFSNNREEQ